MQQHLRLLRGGAEVTQLPDRQAISVCGQLCSSAAANDATRVQSMFIASMRCAAQPHCAALTAAAAVNAVVRKIRVSC